MSEVIKSLKHYRLSKDIHDLKAKINPVFNQQHNLSDVFIELYRSNLISQDELLLLITRFELNKFCLSLENHLEDLLCGVYLYDENEQRVWVGAAPNVPKGCQEYLHGKRVEFDINGGVKSPVYLNDTLMVSDVNRAKDVVTLNHKNILIKEGINSYYCVPLQYNDCMIGHVVLFSFTLRDITAIELSILQKEKRIIEKKMFQIKDQLIIDAKNKKII